VSRPKERHGRRATIGQNEDYELAQLKRHANVWRHYRAVFDADPKSRGRATRAEVACMERFEIDRKTVQRKVSAVQPIMDEMVKLQASDRRHAVRIEANLALVRRMVGRAVEAGILTPDMGKEIDRLSFGTAIALLDACGISRN
jgi:hypothetical protein